MLSLVKYIHPNPLLNIVCLLLLIDIVSPTGSGKTLAYLLPMVDHLKKQEEEVGSILTKSQRPRGLILTTNKELVLQTKNVGKMLGHSCKIKCEGLGIGRNIVQ